MAYTLREYRQWVARELGAFQAGTATAGSSASALEDASWPLQSTLSQDDLWADAYLLRPDAALAADRVRVVKTYTPVSGLLMPDRAWTNAPAAGEAYELHTVVEPSTAFTELLNAALKRCLLAVEVSLPAVASQQRHSLAVAAPWLSDPAWVRQVGFLAPNEARDEADPFRRVVRGQAVADGAGTVSLEHPGYTFGGDETLYVRLLKRAYDHCAPAGGSFGDQSGLSQETDACPADLAWAGWATLVEAWRRFGQALESGAQKRLLPNRQEAAATFTRLTEQHLVVPPVTFRPLLGGGPGA